MSPRLKIALIRFARAVGYGAFAAAITEAPQLQEALPADHWSLPVITALLLAADKLWRVRRYKDESRPPANE